jgi:hypothetical protein
MSFKDRMVMYAGWAAFLMIAAVLWDSWGLSIGKAFGFSALIVFGGFAVVGLITKAVTRLPRAKKG